MALEKFYRGNFALPRQAKMIANDEHAAGPPWPPEPRVKSAISVQIKRHPVTMRRLASFWPTDGKK